MANKEDWQNAYDDTEDIKENQGYIPIWFSILFYGSIFIGVVYGITYHFIADWSQAKEYRQEIALYKKMHPNIKEVKLTKNGKNPLRKDVAAIAAGKKTFATSCAMCHNTDASGSVGPSLIDSKWLHGKTDKKVLSVIIDGVTIGNAKLKPSKGPMPAHKNSLGEKKVLEVMAWLASITKNF